MEIQHPRRILALGAPDSGVLALLKELTGSAPVPTSPTTAGLSHTWTLSTKYYIATLPIWVDEIPSVAEWRSEFIKEEAREVITVLGAWVFCFRRPVYTKDLDDIKEALKAIADVIERACGYNGDAVCLAVAMPQSTTPYLDMPKEEWDELCMEYGFEYIDFEESVRMGKKKNEFGEEVGVKRVREALEANDWEGGEGELDIGEWEDEEEGLEGEEREMGVELFGLKAAVHEYEEESEDDGEEGQVEELESMMRKMLAIKETSEGMPEAERKRFAAKAVNDLMKDL